MSDRDKEIWEARKALLDIYRDNSLQEAGFSIAMIVAFATELAEWKNITGIKILSISILDPVLFATFVLGATMFLGASYWGWVTQQAIDQNFPSPKADDKNPMKTMHEQYLGQGCRRIEFRLITLKGIGMVSLAALIIGAVVACI